jgi:hypothetical protein
LFSVAQSGLYREEMVIEERPKDAERPPLNPGPVVRGSNRLQWVNEPQTKAELAALRESVARGSPFGSPDWRHATAQQLGLESSLRPRARPRKAAQK